MASAILRVPSHMVSYMIAACFRGTWRAHSWYGCHDLEGVLRQITPWLGQIMSTGSFSASTSSIFFSTSSLNGVRMFA